MRRDIIIVENFYSDPDAIVRYAHGLEYVFPYQQPGTPEQDQRVTWFASRYRSGRDCPFKSSPHLIARLEQVTGEPIDLASWNQEFPVDDRGYPTSDHAAVGSKSAWWNCCFHAKPYVGQQLGAGVHSHTDYDSWNPVGRDGWAGIIYLNKEPTDTQAGLRTWVNKDPRREFDWMTPKENWVLRDTFANVYNRLILHRGRIPHSGADGWGSTLADSRFFQTVFFRTARCRETSGIELTDLHLPA
jgi:hypothetical protein